MNEVECKATGGTWANYPWNMDEFGTAMLTIFVFSTLEGWNDLVYTYLDANDSSIGPVFENRMWMLGYNLTVIYFCAFFCVNLFVGVIFLNYLLAEERNKNSLLSENQSKYLKLSKKVLGI